MLQTLVILFACLIFLAILGLMFYAAHEADMSIERRIQDAESGGRRLSIDEQAAVVTRGLRPRDALPPGEGNFTPQSRRLSWLLLGVPLLAGFVVGQLIADALDISGMERMLVCSGAIGVLSWVVLMSFGLYRRRQQQRATGE